MQLTSDKSPVFVRKETEALLENTEENYWDDHCGYSDPGTNASVHAVDNSDVYAGGSFTHAG
jgi:hypothetical protein